MPSTALVLIFGVLGVWLSAFWLADGTGSRTSAAETAGVYFEGRVSVHFLLVFACHPYRIQYTCPWWPPVL